MNKKITKETIFFFTLLAIVVVAAFVYGGWIGGLHMLSFVVNLIGYLILLVVKLIFAIPDLTQTIIQNIITTLLIWGVSTGCWLTKKEEKTVSKIIVAVVSAIFTFISWSNLIG